jgi:hypothetical protein
MHFSNFLLNFYVSIYRRFPIQKNKTKIQISLILSLRQKYQKSNFRHCLQTKSQKIKSNQNQIKQKN